MKKPHRVVIEVWNKNHEVIGSRSILCSDMEELNLAFGIGALDREYGALVNDIRVVDEIDREQEKLKNKKNSKKKSTLDMVRWYKRNTVNIDWAEWDELDREVEMGRIRSEFFDKFQDEFESTADMNDAWDELST
jgi:hypothetical protein